MLGLWNFLSYEFKVQPVVDMSKAVHGRIMHDSL